MRHNAWFTLIPTLASSRSPVLSDRQSGLAVCPCGALRVSLCRRLVALNNLCGRAPHAPLLLARLPRALPRLLRALLPRSPVPLPRVPRRLHQDDPAAPAARQPAAHMQSGLWWGCVTETLFICLSGSLTWFHALAFFLWPADGQSCGCPLDAAPPARSAASVAVPMSCMLS